MRPNGETVCSVKTCVNLVRDTCKLHNNNNNNTQIAALVLPPSTMHPQLWGEQLHS